MFTLNWQYHVKSTFWRITSCNNDLVTLALRAKRLDTSVVHSCTYSNIT